MPMPTAINDSSPRLLGTITHRNCVCDGGVCIFLTYIFISTTQYALFYKVIWSQVGL